MKKIVYVCGTKYKGLIEKCIELDKRVYENKYVGDLDLYKEAYKKDCNNFIFAIDTNTGEVAGYLFATPLKDKTYERMRTGFFIDTETISINEIESLKKDSLNNIYIYSIVVNPEYQGMGISKKLVDTLMNRLKKISAEGYCTKSILADTVNPKVFGNLSRYGLVPINRSKHNSVIVEKVISNKKSFNLLLTQSEEVIF